MSKKYVFDFVNIANRIYENTDIKNLSELAIFLKKSQPYLSKKKKKNEFEVEWAYFVGVKYDLLTEWILTGEGPKSLNELKKPVNYKFETLKYLEQWLAELVVNEPNRREWFKVSVEDAFPMFKAWMKRREEQEGKNSNPPQSKIG